ncbi:hypothetical protein [Vibrio sp. TBV020]|uniref:hypothetical protein n=1 Tax=Vibrio sp. TBV020 TaxID=3137398 RepID=UPI0038CD8A08
MLIGCDSTNSTLELSQPVHPPAAFNIVDISSEGNDVRFTWSTSEVVSQSSSKYTVCIKELSKEDQCTPLATGFNVNSLLVTSLSPLSAIEHEFFVIHENAAGSVSSNEETLSSNVVTNIIQYLKASNSGNNLANGDKFSSGISLSGDGLTLAIGAPEEDSDALGVNGDKHNEIRSNSGAVYIYRYDNGRWIETDYIKSSGAEIDAFFGKALELNHDGSRLVVGADAESSFEGAAYVYYFDGYSWTEEAHLKAPTPTSGDSFGENVTIDADGETLAIGSKYADSWKGKSYIFTRSGNSWSLEKELSITPVQSNGVFGDTVNLSDDGKLLAVSSPGDNTNATSNGAIYLYRKVNGNWVNEAQLLTSNKNRSLNSGFSMTLSGDGRTIASSTMQTNSGGTIFLFTYDGASWSETGTLQAPNKMKTDRFGFSLDLNHDGSALAVGATYENSDFTGINGEKDSNANQSGAAYIFKNSNGIWQHNHHIKASNTGNGDEFGYSVSLTSDGDHLAVGAINEDEYSTNSGAVYIY